MKKNPIALASTGRATWRDWSFAVLMSCAIATAPLPALAQSPGAGQATMNFVGADIESVIKAIGHYIGRTFVIDPRVKGTISVISEKPVSKAEAFSLLTSALRLQGYAVVTVDGFSKVVPEPDAKLQAGPIQTGNLRGDQIATQIFRLNYESATNMVAVLRPLISPNNTINANPGNNSIIITDYADNLRRLSRIIAALDSPASGADLDVIPVRHAIASDLAVMINRLLEPQAGVAGADTGRVSALADSRTNSVIVRAPSAARANLAKSLIARLDTPTAQPGNVHVVYLRNAEAVKLAQTLRAVIASDSSMTQGTTPQQAGPTPAPAQNQAGAGAAPQPLAASQPAALPTGGAGGFIQADAATNTLIITANESVYRNLRTVIDQLDARRAQVYVESLIVEVTADRTAELGIQWLTATGDATSSYRVGGGTAFSTAGNNIFAQAASKLGPANTLLPPSNGLTLGLFRQIGGQLGLGALAHALESNANANILSIPNLITLDNEEARIIVGQNVPFITGQFTTAASGGAAGVNPFQTIERRDIGLSLRVRPQVSEGGSVKMAIYQESSNIQDATNAAGIITNKRSIETNVLVDDGQIIVLGGLIEDRFTDGADKVPVLGDIPVLGGLFRYTTRKRTKTNLMVFLRPIVIRNTEQSTSVVTDRYDYMRTTEMASQPVPSMILPEVAAPVLPPLIDGRPVGGALVQPLRAIPLAPAVMPDGQPVPFVPVPAPVAPAVPIVPVVPVIPVVPVPVPAQ